MIPWHAQSLSDIFSQLNSSENGLSSREATHRRKKWGPNILMQKKKESIFAIFFRQFRSIVILVLLAVFFLSLFTANWVESLAIFSVIFVNTLIGFFSEWKAARTMEALLQLGQAKATVLRKGKKEHISSKEIVPGDILLLDPNEPITADARLIESKGLRVNEAALTGESLPVIKGVGSVGKDEELPDRTNMVYKGTKVSDGEGKAIVVATGNQTEIGCIVGMATSTKNMETPLQKQLNILGKRSVLFVALIAFLIGVTGFFLGKPIMLMIYTAIALGVAAVPEGLPIVAVIALARGMYKMAKKNVLINRLEAVETLGSTTIIFADKTGTLTKNEMIVSRVITHTKDISMEDTTNNSIEELKKDFKKIIQKEKDPLILQALKIGLLCNNAQKNPKEKEGEGDPMELALLEVAKEAGLSRESLLKEYPEKMEVSFDRSTMMMATFHQMGDKFFVAVKGAPENVIDTCSFVAKSKEERATFSKSEKKQWKEAVSILANGGLRLLAMAQKEAGDEKDLPYEKLTLIGLIGFYDPPAEEVGRAIAECRNAGIRVIMVTGDQAETAKSVAASVGIIEDKNDPNEILIVGSELQNPKKLKGIAKQRMHSSNLFARVTPKQKLLLIQLYQGYGEVVAMTGDGVNDAPGLKKADIGIAMGKRGSDAAKQVADMILKNDKFTYIATAVEQGRLIFKNIRKSVMFMLCTNGAQIVSVATASFFSWNLPLTPMQILYLNVLTDVFPALALSVGEKSGNEMKAPPRSKKEKIITNRHFAGIGIWSLIIGFVVLLSMKIGSMLFMISPQEATTISFLTLGMTKLWFTFNLREIDSPSIKNEITRNKWIWFALLLCLCFLVAAVYFPFLSFLLQTELSHSFLWGWILSYSFIPLIIGQALLLFAKKKRERQTF